MTAAQPPLPPAGWYPDPNGAQTLRYFDGRSWTDQLAPLGSRTPDNGLSTKSSLAAGLLQLFLGWFGLGRFYLGYTVIGVVQLVLGVVGLLLTVVFIGWLILVPLSLWVFIEGIMMIAGAVRDAQGRKLR